jgi:TolA-binding protein
MLNSIKILIIVTIVASGLFIPGCGTSTTTEKEAPLPPPQPSATELMQKQMNELKVENESLKKQVTECEESKRAITAHAAELETQLSELKEKQLPPTPEKIVITDFYETYNEALNLFRSRNYKKSAEIFLALIEQGIPTIRQDNCYYWLGECAYGEKKYEDAINYFQKVFTYKISEKKDESQLMIANSYLAMGNKQKAVEEYEKLLKKFPASPFVKRVKEKLEHLK